ncbi:MAG: hypothetical protein LBN95_04060 [Prevotellaceae bacterium]|jgi:hypothetical protein|nr:hypothetical protein [Prevotellaceae bacterium]
MSTTQTNGAKTAQQTTTAAATSAAAKQAETAATKPAPQEKPAEKSETQPQEVVKIQLQPLPQPAEQQPTIKMPTLQELKNRTQILFSLQEKHTELTEKRLSLDKFAISSDNQNATVTITDVKGQKFTSNNPNTIGEVIKLWKEQFDTAINEVESKIFETYQFNNPQGVEVAELRKAA